MEINPAWDNVPGIINITGICLGRGCLPVHSWVPGCLSIHSWVWGHWLSAAAALPHLAWPCLSAPSQGFLLKLYERHKLSSGRTDIGCIRERRWIKDQMNDKIVPATATVWPGVPYIVMTVRSCLLMIKLIAHHMTESSVYLLWDFSAPLYQFYGPGLFHPSDQVVLKRVPNSASKTVHVVHQFNGWQRTLSVVSPSSIWSSVQCHSSSESTPFR